MNCSPHTHTIQCTFLNSSLSCLGSIDILPVSAHSPFSTTSHTTTLFQLVLTSDNIRIFEKNIDNSINFNYNGESTITFLNNSAIDCSLTFNDSTTCRYVLSTLHVIKNGETPTLLVTPTLENISFLSSYLCSVHRIMRHIITYNIVQQDFINNLYNAFLSAESVPRFDILHHFYHIIIELFRLRSTEIASILLSPNNISNTVACLEYHKASSNYQTMHRDFLHKIKLHNILSLNNNFKQLAKTNYYIAYIKKILVTHFSDMDTIIDPIIIQNNHSIMEIIFADKQFEKKIIMSLVPIMVCVNEKLVLSAKPNETAFRFLKELVSLRMSDSIKKRLVRKLCNAGLLEFLDIMLLGTSHTCVIELLIELYRAAPSRMHEYILVPESKLMHTIINRIITKNDSDYLLEFLQTILPPFNPNSNTTDYRTTFINTYLNKIINSLFTNPNLANKGKIYDFIGFLIQTQPELCYSYFNKLVTLFIKSNERLLIDMNFTGEKKLETICSSQLLHNIITHCDDHFLYSTVNRTGFVESIITQFLANRADNMISSVLQQNVAKITERCLNVFMKLGTNKLLDNIPPQTIIHILEQISYAFQSGIKNAENALIQPNQSSNKVIPLIRNNSLEIYTNKYENLISSQQNSSTHFVPFPQQLAIQKMAFVSAKLIRNRQMTAIRRWKLHTIPNKEPDPFMMDAIHLLAKKLELERRKTVQFVLKRNIVPIVKRVYLRDFFNKWNHYISQLPKKLSIECDDYPSNYSSCSSRSSIGYGELCRTSSIGEQLDMDVSKKEEYKFYLIQSLKDKSFLFKNTVPTG